MPFGRPRPTLKVTGVEPVAGNKTEPIFDVPGSSPFFVMKYRKLFKPVTVALESRKSSVPPLTTTMPRWILKLPNRFCEAPFGMYIKAESLTLTLILAETSKDKLPVL